VSFEACRALKPRLHLVELDELMSIFRTEVQYPHLETPRRELLQPHRRDVGRAFAM
jgi:hypothetical protein